MPERCYDGRGVVMSMHVNLTPEQERLVQDELRSGLYASVEEVIAEALKALHGRERSTEPTADERAAVREMLEFARKSSVRLDGVSVRELIHEGHKL